LREARNGSQLAIAGLVLVRQLPGSARGVMFVTLEDESANANLIAWPSVFERHRRPILSATMLGCRGKVQRASGVIHLIVESVANLSRIVKEISARDAGFPIVSGRGDDAKRGGSGLDSREPKAPPLIKPGTCMSPTWTLKRCGSGRGISVRSKRRGNAEPESQGPSAQHGAKRGWGRVRPNSRAMYNVCAVSKQRQRKKNMRAAKADTLAQESLIPSSILEQVVWSPDSSLDDLTTVSARALVPVTVVAGRWQRDHQNYKKFSRLIDRSSVRSVLLPGNT
jgi:OB-fold nucleic acid binding protein